MASLRGDDNFILVTHDQWKAMFPDFELGPPITATRRRLKPVITDLHYSLSFEEAGQYIEVDLGTDEARAKRYTEAYMIMASCYDC